MLRSRWLAPISVAVAGLLAGAWWLSSGAPQVTSAETAARESPSAAAGQGGPDAPEAQAASHGARAGADLVLRAAESAAGAMEVNAPAARAPLWGRVLDARGEPIEAARVLAAQHQQFFRPLDDPLAREGSKAGVQACATDAEGCFGFEGFEPGELRLAVRASGFAPYDAEALAIPPSVPHRLHDIQLKAGVILHGFVRSATGHPVEGVSLLRMDPELDALRSIQRTGQESGALAAKTDARGAFEIDCLSSGPWRLLARSDQHPDQIVLGPYAAAGDRVGPIEIRLAPGARIAGRVLGLLEPLHDSNGRPRYEILALRSKGAQQSFHEAANIARRAEVDADGRFEIEGLVPDVPWRVWAQVCQADGLRGRPLTDSVVVLAPQAQLVLRRDAGVQARFCVLDALTKAPLDGPFEVRAQLWRADAPGASERLESADLVAHGAGGFTAQFQLRAKPDQTLLLAIESALYQRTESKPVFLTSSGVVDCGTIECQRRAWSRIEVHSGVDGRPLAGARVWLYPAGSSEGDGDEPDALARAESAADGVALLGWDGSAAVRLRVEAAGHAPLLGEALSAAPDGAPHRVTLPAPAALIVHVVDDAGLALSGQRVLLERTTQESPSPATAWSHSAFSDARGRAAFESLPSGRIQARIAGLASSGPGEVEGRSWRFVDLAVGASDEITLVAPALATLEATLRDGGRVLDGASVGILCRRTQDDKGALRAIERRRATTDGFGRFFARELEPGRALLVVFHADFALPVKAECELLPGANRLDIELGSVRLEGSVLSTSGDPLEGVRIALAVPEMRLSRHVLQVGTPLSTPVGGVPLLAAQRGQIAWIESDALGRFEFRGLDANQGYELLATHSRHLLQLRSIEPARSKGVTSEIELRMEPGATLRVRLVSADPTAPARSQVLARPEKVRVKSVERRSAFHAADEVVLEGLAPGRWRIEVLSATAGSPRSQRVELEPSRETVLVFDLDS